MLVFQLFPASITAYGRRFTLRADLIAVRDADEHGAHLEKGPGYSFGVMGQASNFTLQARASGGRLTGVDAICDVPSVLLLDGGCNPPVRTRIADLDVGVRGGEWG